MERAEETTFYVIVVELGEMVATAYGTGPAAAVDAYYDDLDGFCAPSDDLGGEEVTVQTLSIPADLEGEVRQAVDDLAGDAMPVIDELVAGRPDAVWSEVNVEFSGGERRVQLAASEGG